MTGTPKSQIHIQILSTLRFFHLRLPIQVILFTHLKACLWVNG